MIHSKFNPYRTMTPPGWKPISQAPRDGTVVEIQNNWGVAPWFGLFKFEDDEWISATEAGAGVSDGTHLSWRPYDGDPAEYLDPTAGRQEDPEYWLEAAGWPAHRELMVPPLNAFVGEVVEQTTKKPVRTGLIAAVFVLGTAFILSLL